MKPTPFKTQAKHLEAGMCVDVNRSQTRPGAVEEAAGHGDTIKWDALHESSALRRLVCQKCVLLHRRRETGTEYEPVHPIEHSACTCNLLTEDIPREFGGRPSRASISTALPPTTRHYKARSFSSVRSNSRVSLSRFRSSERMSPEVRTGPSTLPLSRDIHHET